MQQALKVVLAGAAGHIGRPILDALRQANFDITILTRPDSTTNNPWPADIKVVEADYSNLPSLTSIFDGKDVFISALGGAAAVQQQKTLIDAAVAAKVRRILPSEFGSDLANPRAATLPFFANKLELQRYLEQATQGTSTSWTAVRTGPFLDLCVDYGLIMDIKNYSIKLYDGGDVLFTTTPTKLVAQSVVAVLKKLGETENKVVKVQGARLTQNQLLTLARKFDDRKWTVERLSSSEVEKESFRKLEEDGPANAPMSVWVGFLIRAFFAEGYGGDFGDDHDNEMLGVKEMTEEEVEEFVRSRVIATKG